ncbi:MAG: hypothetical protein C4297_05720 [Gemmataceae bacterium]
MKSKACLLVGLLIALSHTAEAQVRGAPTPSPAPRVPRPSFGGGSTARAPLATSVSPLPGSMTRPVFSPYLNLLRRGNPVINYYGLVRPINEFSSFQAQQMGINTAVQRQMTAGRAEEPGAIETPRLGPTGHPVYFMNYSHYFGLGRGR